MDGDGSGALGLGVEIVAGGVEYGGPQFTAPPEQVEEGVGLGDALPEGPWPVVLPPL